MEKLESLEIIILISSALYFLGLAAFLPGLARGLKRKKDFPFASLPRVSVLVCARNEEKNIDSCLRAFQKLDYPAELLEILIVDDRSTDNISALLRACEQKLPNLK